MLDNKNAEYGRPDRSSDFTYPRLIHFIGLLLFGLIVDIELMVTCKLNYCSHSPSHPLPTSFVSIPPKNHHIPSLPQLVNYDNEPESQSDPRANSAPSD